MSDDEPDIENLIVEPIEFKQAEAVKKSTTYKLKPLTIFLLIAFLLLALVVLFMFSARVVKFTLEPKPDSLQVVNGFFSYQLGDRFLMLSGEYTLGAEAQGYHRLEQDIVVTHEAEQEFKLTFKKLPGILQINTQPEAAGEIFVDEESVGSIPLTLDQISPGDHLISVVPERYLPLDEMVSIEGKGVRQSLEFKLTPAWANIEITSLPQEAIISIDGEETGSSPATLAILRGTHSLELRKKGYKTWKTDIKVFEGHDQILPMVELEVADGSISISSRPSGASTTISGRYYGQTPVNAKLPPSETYTINISKSGFRTARKTVTIEPDEDLELDITLDAIKGVVRLSVKPEGSILYVDGKNMGDASQRLSLTASMHELRIEKEGFAAYKTQMTPQPGLDQHLRIDLKTVEQAEVEALPKVLSTAFGQKLRLIIPDRMTMGAGRREPGRRSNEILREIQLIKPYYLGEKEVNNKEFAAFDPGHDSGVLDRSVLNQGDRPVVNISWNDAVKYCNWLSERDQLPKAYVLRNNSWQLAEPTNSGYRLPTEAEWAWAARYTSNNPQPFPWGNTLPPPSGAGNFADASAFNMVPQALKGYNDTFRGTAPVGSFKANESGIYDLAGNVAEWVHDYYGVNPQRKVVEDPTGPDTGEFYVIRGSSFLHGRFSELRWVYREFGKEPRPDLGFRIARYLE